MATFCPEGLCIAELPVWFSISVARERKKGRQACVTHQTTPYAPSPTTSWISYCSLTLKEILRDPAGLGGFDRDMVSGIRLRGPNLTVETDPNSGRRDLIRSTRSLERVAHLQNLDN